MTQLALACPLQVSPVEDESYYPPPIQSASQALQQLHPPAGMPSPRSLPDIEPDRVHILVWLSDNILGWRSIARNLGLEEADIERIIEGNPYNVTEQCYQMFEKWKRQRSSKFSCQTLGEALLKSERNKGLYPEFVQRVNESLTRVTIL